MLYYNISYCAFAEGLPKSTFKLREGRWVTVMKKRYPWGPYGLYLGCCSHEWFKSLHRPNAPFLGVSTRAVLPFRNSQIFELKFYPWAKSKVSNNRDFPRSNDGERCTKPASSLPIQLSPFKRATSPFSNCWISSLFKNSPDWASGVPLLPGPSLLRLTRSWRSHSVALPK